MKNIGDIVFVLFVHSCGQAQVVEEITSGSSSEMFPPSFLLSFPGTGEYFSSGNDLSNAINPPDGETPLNYSTFVTALIEHSKVNRGGSWFK